jgi:hypothetical protein
MRLAATASLMASTGLSRLDKAAEVLVAGMLGPACAPEPGDDACPPGRFWEAVNADMEGYSQVGFADAGSLARTYPLRPAGRAWLRASRHAVLVHVMAADRAWFAPIPKPAAVLASVRGGILAGVTCDRDPGRLAADTGHPEHAIANGEVLLGWSPLPGGQDEHREPGRLC